MQLSDKGLALICGFEGYHRALPNGDCTTYYCPAGVLTIGFGCTEGIREGEVWTRARAEDALRRELAKHEAAVARLVTVDMTQGQFDALVSFSYNCGTGALARSTLLRKFNAGDKDGAAAAFSSWTRGGGRELPGLVRRRAAEAALFRTEDAPAAQPDMPQRVDPPPPVEEHTEAHEELKEQSLLYKAKRWLLKMLGLGAGGIGLEASADADPFALLSSIAGFIQANSIMVAGGVVLAIVGLEVAQFIQRRGAIGQ